jgi:hypothetical protein
VKRVLAPTTGTNKETREYVIKRNIIKFKKINQPDATISQVYYLMFRCRSTCFGRLHAHYQELTTALTASGFTLECGGKTRGC